ncbi:MAG: hypothetical protein AB1546_10860 [bacterium]
MPVIKNRRHMKYITNNLLLLFILFNALFLNESIICIKNESEVRTEYVCLGDHENTYKMAQQARTLSESPVYASIHASNDGRECSDIQLSSGTALRSLRQNNNYIFLFSGLAATPIAWEHYFSQQDASKPGVLIPVHHSSLPIEQIGTVILRN